MTSWTGSSWICMGCCLNLWLTCTTMRSGCLRVQHHKYLTTGWHQVISCTKKNVEEVKHLWGSCNRDLKTTENAWRESGKGDGDIKVHEDGIKEHTIDDWTYFCKSVHVAYLWIHMDLHGCCDVVIQSLSDGVSFLSTNENATSSMSKSIPCWKGKGERVRGNHFFIFKYQQQSWKATQTEKLCIADNWVLEYRYLVSN